MSRMSDQASRRFRTTALIMTAALAIPQAAEVFKAPHTVNSWLPAALALALASAFGYAFWLITALPPGRTPRWVHALLLLQALTSFALAADLLPLLSAELGYVLPPKEGRRWYAAIVILLAIVGTVAVYDGSFEATSGLAHLPFWAQVAATLLQMSCWTLFAFTVGRLLAHEREEREEYTRLNAELQSTRELLVQSSQAGERLRIARELHDTLGHHLTALAVNLDLATRVDRPQAAEVIGRAHLLSKLLLNDVRDTVAVMRQEPPIDLEKALHAIVGSVPPLHVYLDISPALHITAEQAHALLRAAQEGVTNAVRHAGAHRVWISAVEAEGFIELSVRDDGQGSGAIEPGNGLTGMRERLKSLGGRLEFGRHPNGGFRVQAILPVEVQS